MFSKTTQPTLKTSYQITHHMMWKSVVCGGSEKSLLLKSYSLL